LTPGSKVKASQHCQQKTVSISILHDLLFQNFFFAAFIIFLGNHFLFQKTQVRRRANESLKATQRLERKTLG
jgi:hypothetical protein